MNERERAITNLMVVDLRGGSHEMLSSIAKAIYKPTCGGWTIGACQVLRDTLVNLLSETDEEALREAYTKGREDGMGMANAKDAHAEYLRGRNDGYDDGWDAGFASADDWLGQHEDAMAEHGWVRLPKDTDGEYIHIGDKVTCGASVWEVTGFRFTGGFWGICCTILNGQGGSGTNVYPPSDLHHHHAPTVEDVLREMHVKLDEVTALYVGEAIDSDERDSDEARIFAEYAAKLQLRGDVE